MLVVNDSQYLRAKYDLKLFERLVTNSFITRIKFMYIHVNATANAILLIIFFTKLRTNDKTKRYNFHARVII